MINSKKKVDIKRNISRSLLFYLLELDSVDYEKEIVNTYIKDVDKEYSFPVIHVLISLNTEVSKLSKLDKSFKKLPVFIESASINENYVMYTFKIPDKYLEDYERFLLGKYSQYSTKAKNQILQYSLPWGINFQVLTKQPPKYKDQFDLKKDWEAKIGIKFNENQELFSSPDIDKETFNIKKFVKQFS